MASVRNEFNAVQVQGAFAEKQLFIGKGAGSYPTGSAVLSDISALSYDYAYEYKKRNQLANLTFSNDLLVEVFVSFAEENQVTIQDFDQFESGYTAFGKQYMVGLVKLAKLKEWNQISGIGIILAPQAKFVATKRKEKLELV